MGKHFQNNNPYIKQLEETIRLKDKEIEDIKMECAEQFKQIRTIASNNSLGNVDIKIRKIIEIASDNFIALLKDMYIENDHEEESKIIELPITDESNR